MKICAVVMLGGALGSALRYGLALWITEKYPTTFPWGTFAVNVIGSFVIGLVMGLGEMEGSFFASPVVRAFMVIGVLGGFTTFSSFSYQTFALMQGGHWGVAIGNVMASVFVCLLGTAGGVLLAQALTAKS